MELDDEQCKCVSTASVSLLFALIVLKLVIKEITHDAGLVYNWIMSCSAATAPDTLLTSASVAEYLGTLVDTPHDLIKGMAKNNFILSGTCALDWFEPGFADQSYDIDFYAHNSSGCIKGAMHTLAKCGVKWEDPTMAVRKILYSSEEKTMRISSTAAKDFTDTWAEIAIESTPRTHFQPLIASMDGAIAKLNRHTALDTIDVKVNKATSIIHVDGHGHELHEAGLSDSQQCDTLYGANLIILRGTFKSNGITRTVRLVSSPGGSPIDLVPAFYASHVQCFVSAFGAAHLYYPADKTATTWSLNTQHRPSANAALETYEQRGHTFHSLSKKHGDRELRQVNDAQGPAKLSEFSFDFAFDIVPQTVQSIRRQALRKLLWVETAERTWRVRDDEVEQAMNQWIRGRNKRASITAANGGDPDGDFVATTHFCKAWKRFRRYADFEVEKRQGRDTLLLF